MTTMERYKKLYGDGEFQVLEGNKIFIPLWAYYLLLHHSGIRSKKQRIRHKVVLREFNKAILRGLER